EGSQGPRYYEWTWFQLPYPGEVGCAHWLIARRSLSTPQDIAYYHAYAPATSTLADLVLIAGRRWAIEVGFEQTRANWASTNRNVDSGGPGIAISRWYWWRTLSWSG